MSQHLVSTPFFAELDRRALEVPVILLELAFESRKQGKRVARRTRKSRQNLIVVKPPHLPRAGFHHSFAHCHLPVPGERNVRAFPDEQHSRATNPIFFRLHLSLTRL